MRNMKLFQEIQSYKSRDMEIFLHLESLHFTFFFRALRTQCSSAPAFEVNILPCLFEVVLTRVFASSLLEKGYLSAAIVGAYRHLSCKVQIGLCLKANI